MGSSLSRRTTSNCLVRELPRVPVAAACVGPEQLEQTAESVEAVLRIWKDDCQNPQGLNLVDLSLDRLHAASRCFPTPKSERALAWCINLQASASPPNNVESGIQGTFIPVCITTTQLLKGIVNSIV